MKFAFLFLFLPFIACAEGSDPKISEALSHTLRMLMTPDVRSKIVDKDKSGPIVAAVKQAEKVGGGPENTEKVFKLAFLIFESLMREAKGDPAKLTQIIADLQRNPAALEAKLTPEEKALMSEIAKNIN